MTPNKIECMLNNRKLFCVLEPLQALPSKTSDDVSSKWPWQHDVNWFLALAEFKRLTQQQAVYFFMLEVWSENTCCLAMPLCSSADGRYWSSLTDVYSPSFDIIASTISLIENPWQCVLQALTLMNPNWVDFQILPLKQEQIQQLTQMNGFPRQHVFQHSENWVAHFNSTHEFWRKRPSQLKNTIKRKTAKLLKHDSRVEIHTNLTEELMHVYWRVYHQSWKEPELDPYFINWLANYSSSNGMLRLGVLYIANQPVACQLWLVNQSKAAIYKLAQDQAFDNLSPGTVLMADMVNYVIQIDQVNEIDFLTGKDSYKALWMDKTERLYGVDFYNTLSVLGRFYWFKQRIKTTIKTIYTYLKSSFLRGRNDSKS